MPKCGTTITQGGIRLTSIITLLAIAVGISKQEYGSAIAYVIKQSGFDAEGAYTNLR